MAKDYDNQWYICLVLHKSGEFAERYTGFIGKVETWYEKNALAETCIFAACEALEEITLPENAKTRVTEKARFRFHGWLQENKMAIEHECVLVLNNAREKRSRVKRFQRRCLCQRFIRYSQMVQSGRHSVRGIPKTICTGIQW